MGYLRNVNLEIQIKLCLEFLRQGDIIAFPSETGWQLACDALDETAVDRLTKNIGDSSVAILIASNRDLLQYVAAPDPRVFDYLDEVTEPVFIEFENGIGLASNVLTDDGSVSIRIVHDEFCKHLIKRFGRPLAVADLIGTDDPSSPNPFNIDPKLQEFSDFIVDNTENLSTFRSAKWIKWKDQSIQ